MMMMMMMMMMMTMTMTMMLAEGQSFKVVLPALAQKLIDKHGAIGTTGQLRKHLYWATEAILSPLPKVFYAPVRFRIELS
eukprot:5420218-Amphidinium_carterae.1